MTTKNPQKIPKYVCEFCEYITSNKKDYNKHLLTAKHSKTTNNNGKVPKIPLPYFECPICASVFNDRAGLWRHKKKCKQEPDILLHDANQCQDVSVLTNLVIDLVKSNGELQKQMIEACKATSTINNNTNNSHNKTFNLQLYLNETCKDAMNIMDFVDSIKFQLSDLESIGELGYINGLSKVIIRNLKALDENMRPVHCSDLKREKIYIKDADKWEKEGADNKILKNAIKYIAHKNVKMIPAFREKYPDCIYSDSRKSDQYNRLIIEAMGGDGNDEDGKANKIIKRIAKEILIDK
jgi:hypothetical protein